MANTPEFLLSVCLYPPKLGKQKRGRRTLLEELRAYARKLGTAKLLTLLSDEQPIAPIPRKRTQAQAIFARLHKGYWTPARRAELKALYAQAAGKAGTPRTKPKG